MAIKANSEKTFRKLSDLTDFGKSVQKIAEDKPSLSLADSATLYVSKRNIRGHSKC